MNTIQNVFLALALLVGFPSINSSTPIGTAISQSIEQRPEIHKDYLGAEYTTQSNNRKDDWSEKGIHQYEPTHRQKIWVAVLHWCESKGDVNAINPNDLDNTPSYGGYQFKPKTLKEYATKYQLLSDDLKIEDYINWSFDYDLTTEIVYRMINDNDITDWHWKKQLFPGCIKKWGMPPKK